MITKQRLHVCGVTCNRLQEYYSSLFMRSKMWFTPNWLSNSYVYFVTLFKFMKLQCRFPKFWITFTLLRTPHFYPRLFFSVYSIEPNFILFPSLVPNQGIIFSITKHFRKQIFGESDILFYLSRQKLFILISSLNLFTVD